MKFSLIQMFVAVGIVFLIAFIVLTFGKMQPSSVTPSQQPIPSIPFQELKMK